MWISRRFESWLSRKLMSLLGPIHAQIDAIKQEVDHMAIDTSKILAEVARERTDVASLRALVDAMSATMKDLSKQLADAIAANDPAAMAKVQADLDQAATDLSTDNDATEAALKANTPAA